MLGRRIEEDGAGWLCLCVIVFLCVFVTSPLALRYLGKDKSSRPLVPVSLIYLHVSPCRGRNNMINLEGRICITRCATQLHYTIKHNILIHTQPTVGGIHERALSKGGKKSKSKKEATAQCKIILWKLFDWEPCSVAPRHLVTLAMLSYSEEIRCRS